MSALQEPTANHQSEAFGSGQTQYPYAEDAPAQDVVP